MRLFLHRFKGFIKVLSQKGRKERYGQTNNHLSFLGIFGNLLKGKTMKRAIRRDIRHLRPTDRWWYYIAECAKPHTRGPLWPREIVQMVFGTEDDKK